MTTPTRTSSVKVNYFEETRTPSGAVVRPEMKDEVRLVEQDASGVTLDKLVALVKAEEERKKEINQ